MILLYTIFFSLLLFFNYKKHGITPSTFILGVYWISSICGIILLYGYDHFDASKITFAPVIYHITCLALFLLPVLYFGNIDVNQIKYPSYDVLKYLLWFIIILSIMSIGVSATKVQTAFSYDLNEARRLHNLRELHDDGDRNIFVYLGRLGTDMSFFALFFFFLVLTRYPQKRVIQILLIVSSLSVIISNLSIMGRDGIVRWLFFFATCFLMFRDKISEGLKRKIYMGVSVIFIPIIIIFSLITQARFSEKGDGTMYSVASYLGQSFIYFSYNFDNFEDGMSGGRMVFPSLFPTSERVLLNNLNDSFYADYNLNTFPTFVGSFYLDMGFTKTFFLALGFFIVMFFYLRIHKPQKSFSKLIAFLILYETMLLGVFYYMFTNETSVNVFILIFILCVFLQLHSYFYASKNSNQLNSPEVN